MSLDEILGSSSNAEANHSHWIPLSDLMTGLMMMFLLIAILFMLQVEKEADKVKALMVAAQAQARNNERLKELAEEKTRYVKSIAALYDDTRSQLYNDLQREFGPDLPRWKARLERDLTIRFEEPDVLFDTGKADLKPRFIEILDDFFPRYIAILAGIKYRDAIDEVRVEGHTSSIWSANSSAETAYFKNMELSQTRTRKVLEHALVQPEVAFYKNWLTSKVTANGLSSSKPRLAPTGREDKEASQRVEFKVRTNAEARLGQVLQAAQ